MCKRCLYIQVQLFRWNVFTESVIRARAESILRSRAEPVNPSLLLLCFRSVGSLECLSLVHDLDISSQRRRLSHA